MVEEERQLAVDGVERRYLLTVPTAHDGDTPLPVVFDFHGLTDGADVEAARTGYSAVAERDGVVAVFPEGTGNPLHWDASPDPGNVDLRFFDALVDELGAELCLDTSRIYVTGFSNGAMFTSTLLCERSDVLAAAAPVSGVIDVAGCAPDQPVPLIAFHGTADPVLLFNGGVNLPGLQGGSSTTRPPVDLDGPGFPATVAAFASRNGCAPTPQDTELSDQAVRRVYDCPAGADVEFDIVLGAGHAWPTAEKTASAVDATRDGWEFMRRFRRS